MEMAASTQGISAFKVRDEASHLLANAQFLFQCFWNLCLARCSHGVVENEFCEAIGRVPFGVPGVLEISGVWGLQLQLLTAACLLTSFSF